LDWEAWTDGLGGLVAPTVVVFVFAAVLWADRTQARKLARKWGVSEPTDDQVAEVLRYRRLRLACYPLLYAILGACSGLLLPPEQDQDGKPDEGMALIAMFLLGAVIAELLTFGRARQPIRLRFADLVSRWGLGIFGTLVVLTFVFGLIDLQAQPHITPNVLLMAEQNKNHGGAPIAVPFAGTVVVVLLVAFVLWSAQARSFSSDAEVDRALRTRSARVGLGLGIGMQLCLLALSSWRMDFLEVYAEGENPLGSDPAETAIGDWAKNTTDLVQPWTFLLTIVALFSWISIANPRRSGKTRQLSRKQP
jgi:hypothetical protein